MKAPRGLLNRASSDLQQTCWQTPASQPLLLWTGAAGCLSWGAQPPSHGADLHASLRRLVPRPCPCCPGAVQVGGMQQLWPVGQPGGGGPGGVPALWHRHPPQTPQGVCIGGGGGGYAPAALHPHINILLLPFCMLAALPCPTSLRWLVPPPTTGRGALGAVRQVRPLALPT